MKNYTCQRPRPTVRMKVKNNNDTSSYFGMTATIVFASNYEYEVMYHNIGPTQSRYRWYIIRNFHNLFEVIERP